MACQDYQPDTNGDCRTCGAWADAHDITATEADIDAILALVSDEVRRNGWSPKVQTALDRIEMVRRDKKPQK